MKQLRMRWECAEIERKPLAPGYALVQLTRDTVGKYMAGWLRCWDKAEDDERAFAAYRDDMRIPEDGFFVVIDEASGEAVATVGVQMNEYRPGTATMHYIAADAKHRGKGLGECMAVTSMRFARERGAAQMYLTTDDWRVPAIRMYLKLGFRPVYWDSDMDERWTKLFRNFGIAEADIYDENEKLVHKEFA